MVGPESYNTAGVFTEVGSTWSVESQFGVLGLQGPNQYHGPDYLVPHGVVAPVVVPAEFSRLLGQPMKFLKCNILGHGYRLSFRVLFVGIGKKS